MKTFCQYLGERHQEQSFKLTLQVLTYNTSYLFAQAVYTIHFIRTDLCQVHFRCLICFQLLKNVDESCPFNTPVLKSVSGRGQVCVQVPWDAVPQHCQAILYGALGVSWTEYWRCMAIKTSPGKSLAERGRWHTQNSDLVLL